MTQSPSKARLFLLGAACLFLTGFGYMWVGRTMPTGDSALNKDHLEVTVAGDVGPGEVLRESIENGEREKVLVHAQVPSVPEEPISQADFGEQVLQAWTILVVANNSGQPIQDALVRARFAQGDLESSTDEEGQVTLQVPAGVPCTVEIAVEGYVPRVKPNCLTTTRLTVLMFKCSAIYGTFRGPPAGLSVALFQSLADPKADPQAIVELEEDGSFRFEGLGPGTYSVSVRTGVLGVAKNIAVGIGDEVEVVLQELPGVFPITGQVVSRQGEKPLPGVTVIVQYHALGIPAILERDARVFLETDAEGKVSVPVGEGLRTTVNLLTPWGDFASAGSFDAADWRERDGSVWKFNLPAILGGRVVDAEGNGLAGVRVRLDREPRRGQRGLIQPFVTDPWSMSMNRECHTDETGAFGFGEVPSRCYLVVIAEPTGREFAEDRSDWVGARARIRLNQQEIKEDLTLRAHTEAILLGRLEDKQGLGWAGIRVELFDVLKHSLGSTETNSEGEFSLANFPIQFRNRMPIEFRLDGELIGKSNVRIPKQDNGASEGGRLESSDAGRLLLKQTFVFQRREIVRGWVLDSEGYGIEGALVEAKKTNKQSGRFERATSDAAGAFELVGSWRGPGEVRVSARKQGWISPKPGFQTVTLPHSNDLFLSMNPKPVAAPASVRGEILMGDSGEPLPRLRFEGLRNGWLTTQGSRFEIKGITPGRLNLRVRTNGFEHMSFPRIDLAPGAQVDLGVVRLWRGTDLTIQAKGTGLKTAPKGCRAHLEFISSSNHRPDLEGRRIPLSAPRAGSKKLEFKGSGIPRGRWRLVLKIPGFEAKKQVFGLHRRRVNKEVTPQKNQ